MLDCTQERVCMLVKLGGFRRNNMCFKQTLYGKKGVPDPQGMMVISVDDLHGSNNKFYFPDSAVTSFYLPVVHVSVKNFPINSELKFLDLGNDSLGIQTSKNELRNNPIKFLCK